MIQGKLAWLVIFYLSLKLSSYLARVIGELGSFILNFDDFIYYFLYTCLTYNNNHTQ
ncbi:hypothetical protein HanIR_Chr13g0633341 [Helianthus annuus]|nr:hypothetical protein HanIR_Chr13g0633341 [Helianthus annuus]